MWQPPQSCFEVKPVEPIASQWDAPTVSNDVEKKKQFAFELAKGLKPFEAATNIFPNETGLALWVSKNWVSDPEVIEASKQVEENLKLLDKAQLAAKVLKFSEERDTTGRFYLAEDKTRLAALRLYAEICGYIGRIDIDASTKTFTNNEMKIVLVSPPRPKIDEELKVIEHVHTADILPLKVKLV